MAAFFQSLGAQVANAANAEAEFPGGSEGSLGEEDAGIGESFSTHSLDFDEDSFWDTAQSEPAQEREPSSTAQALGTLSLETARSTEQPFRPASVSIDAIDLGTSLDCDSLIFFLRKVEDLESSILEGKRVCVRLGKRWNRAIRFESCPEIGPTALGLDPSVCTAQPLQKSSCFLFPIAASSNTTMGNAFVIQIGIFSRIAANKEERGTLHASCLEALASSWADVGEWAETPHDAAGIRQDREVNDLNGCITSLVTRSQFTRLLKCFLEHFNEQTGIGIDSSVLIMLAGINLKNDTKVGINQEAGFMDLLINYRYAFTPLIIFSPAFPFSLFLPQHSDPSFFFVFWLILRIRPG